MFVEYLLNNVVLNSSFFSKFYSYFYKFLCFRVSQGLQSGGINYLLFTHSFMYFSPRINNM